MTFEIEILARASIALLIAVVGALVAVSIKKLSHRALCGLISVAAGALLSVTVVEILPESYEMAGPFWMVLGFVTGYLLFFLISKYVYHICPACAATHTEEKFLALSWVMIVAVSIHSLMDGIGVAAGHAAGDESIGLVMLFAISIHKFPEGLALASVARAGGYSRGKSFAIAFAVETTTLVGAIVSMIFIRDIALLWFGVILAHIGGSFVYLTAHAMLGEMIKHERKSILAYAVLGFMVVLVASIAISMLGA